MTGAQIAAARRRAPAPAAQRAVRGQTAPSARLHVLAVGRRAASALRRAAVRHRRDGLPAASTGTSAPTSRRRSARRRSGIQSAILGTLYLMAICAVFVVPARRRDRDLPRGVRRPHEVVQPPDRGQHPEPRRGALGRLRHPRPRVHRARAARLGPVLLAGAMTLGAARAAGRDHRRRARRSAPCRRRSARARWRSARRSGRRSGGRCCPARSPASRPA